MFFLMRKISVEEAKTKGWSGETNKRFVIELNDFGRDVYFPVEKVPALYRNAFESFNRYNKDKVCTSALLGVGILAFMVCFGAILVRFINKPTAHDVFGLICTFFVCAVFLVLIAIHKNPYKKV